MSSVEPEIHEQYGQAQVADLAGRRAYDQAWRGFAGEQSPEEFFRSWLMIQSHMIGGVSDGVVILLKPGTSTFAPVAFFPEQPANRAHLAPISERALYRMNCRWRLRSSSEPRRSTSKVAGSTV